MRIMEISEGLIFLLHHLHTKPFAKHLANLAETVSLATLVVIAMRIRKV